MVNDPGTIDSLNPNLPPIIKYDNDSSTPGIQTTAITTHATAVAGVICSTDPVDTGAAPGLAQLYDGGGSGDIDAPPIWDWAIQQGVSFGNCSWWNFNKGAIVFLDRYFDYIIRNFAVMMFKSAGNRGNSDGLITSPGNGYNTTATGNFFDQDSLDWKDDVMNLSSSWVNPVEGHDKPELTAPGTSIYSTVPAGPPWIGFVGGGTSFATAVSSGTAALLAETKPELLAQPEIVKALLMAGAWNNIDGPSQLSERDGAGGLVAAATQDAAARDQFAAISLTDASFTSDVFDYQIELLAGDRPTENASVRTRIESVLTRNGPRHTLVRKPPPL